MGIRDYLKDIIIVYKAENCGACNQISDILKKFDYTHEKKPREKITPTDFKKNRLAITAGGDGTLLKTCQNIRNDSLVLGVNSNLMLSEGYLTRAKVDNFMQKFRNLITGKAKIIKLPRLEVKINDKTLPYLALNEISISKLKPYLTFIYNLKGNVEKATGILVSTPIGTTAWAGSSGGKRLPLRSKKMEFVIREPYKGKIYSVKNKFGIVDNFTVQALSDGIIVFDSIGKEYPFKKKDTITVTFSDHKLNLIEP